MKRVARPSRRSMVGRAECWEQREAEPVSRGKHSTAAGARRLKAAQDDAEVYRKAFLQEQRAHKITKAAADRIDGLEVELKKLRMDLDLATSDELKAAERTAEEAQERCVEVALYLLTELFRTNCSECGADATAVMSNDVWLRLRDIVGREIYGRLLTLPDDNRRQRRGKDHWRAEALERRLTLMAICDEMGFTAEGRKQMGYAESSSQAGDILRMALSEYELRRPKAAS